MSPVIAIIALTLCAGLIALVRAVLVAPEGREQENGFAFEAIAKKSAKASVGVTLLTAAPARARHTVKAA